MQAETLQGIVEDAADPIVICDAEAIVVYANRAAGDLVGQSLAELVQPGSVQCHTISRTPEGHQICLLTSLQGTRGTVLHAGRIAALGELAVGVSHEVKNPLMMMTGMLELALQGMRDGTVEQPIHDVQSALDASHRINDVLNRLLAFAQGSMPANPQPVRLTEVIHRTHALVRDRMRLSGIRCQVRCPESLCVWGFPDSLGQVFLHLLLNAREAIGPGPGWIRIEHLEDHSDMLTILIQDSGPGVPEALRARIFDPYFSTKANGVGTGLGLSISRELVHAHGGSLTYVEVGERGAFRLSLPWHDDPVSQHDR